MDESDDGQMSAAGYTSQRRERPARPNLVDCQPEGTTSLPYGGLSSPDHLSGHEIEEPEASTVVTIPILGPNDGHQ